MFRRSIPDDYALVFELGRERTESLHMLFVPFDIVAVFLDSDNRVTKKAELGAWTGTAKGTGERIIEFPADKSAKIEEGETLVFE
ncbi:MAG: DUF192 domain-containing protein, partial [Halobacteria archaeon]|nr:DUF192 domain-containing protein [Halobacteria archaeon]